MRISTDISRNLNHPSLGIFIDKIREFESILKQDLLIQINDVTEKKRGLLDINGLLPIEKMDAFIKKNFEKFKIFKNIITDDSFMNEIIKVSHEVYRIFFGFRMIGENEDPSETSESGNIFIFL